MDGRGKVWVWGKNRDGQLGQGDTTPLLMPHLVSFLAFYTVAKVEKISEIFSVCAGCMDVCVGCMCVAMRVH